MLLHSDSDPLVSVVIPTFNRPALLARAVRSVLGQTVQDLEVIVVDDASPSIEENRQVVEGLRDPRVRLVQRAENGRLCRSRNTGIESARGQFIAFLDDDDEWLPGKLRQQLQLFHDDAEATLGAVIGLYSVVDVDGKRLPIGQRPINGWCRDLLLAEPHLQTCGSSLLVRRSVIDDGIRFDPSFPAFEDWDFLVAVSERYRVATVPVPVFNKYEDFEGAHVWNRETAIAGHRRIIEKYLDELNGMPDALAGRRVALAVSHARNGDLDGCRHQLSLAMRLRPSSSRLRLYTLLARLGVRPFLAVCPAMTARGKTARVMKKLRGSLKSSMGRSRQVGAHGA